MEARSHLEHGRLHSASHSIIGTLTQMRLPCELTLGCAVLSPLAFLSPP